jgi:hypothetical protein
LVGSEPGRERRLEPQAEVGVVPARRDRHLCVGQLPDHPAEGHPFAVQPEGLAIRLDRDGPLAPNQPSTVGRRERPSTVRGWPPRAVLVQYAGQQVACGAMGELATVVCGIGSKVRQPMTGTVAQSSRKTTITLPRTAPTDPSRLRPVTVR